MTLVNVLVDQLAVEHSVRVVEENLMEAHADENLKENSGKARQVACDLEPKNISIVVEDN